MRYNNYFKSNLTAILFLFSAVSSYAQFTINYPNASAVWEVGETYTVTWTNDQAAPTIVNITLVYTNGTTALSRSLGVNVPTESESYTFTLDTAYDLGNYYTVCFENQAEEPYVCTETFAVTDSMPNTTGVYEFAAGDINVYPMPLTNTSALYFNLKQSAPVKAVLYDMLGHEIHCLKNETMEAGSVEISIPQLPQSGFYLLRLEIAGKQYTRKLLVE